jgi:hypothetical protein
MTAIDLLPLLDGVRMRGPGKWSARCPSHPDRSPSLTLAEGDRGLLLKCWAGCQLEEITRVLGLSVSDLFFDSLSTDSRQRQATMRRRAEAQAAQLAARSAEGRRLDALREGENLIRSAQGISIDGWSDAQLDAALDRLGDAYHLLATEDLR